MTLMKAISLIFHPLLVATYLLTVLYFYQPQVFVPVTESSVPRLIIATFITTFIIPVLSISMMKMTSRISSLELSTRQERILPFVSITMFYGAAAYIFISRLSISPPLSIMMITSTLLIFVLLVITFRFKISIHAAAIWGICGIVSALSIRFSGMTLLYPLAMTFFVAGLVSASRLYLNFHTPREMWSGSILGFCLCFFMVYFFG